MKIIYKNIDEVIPYENNPRQNDGAVEYVANSIKEFGFKVPIIVDKDNVIVTGHTRLKAAIQLGLKEVPVIYADDLTDEQIKAFRIADNKVGEKSGWDLDKLKIELEDFDVDMTDFGFGDFELSMLTEDMEPEPYDNDEIQEYVDNSDEYLASKRILITYSTEEEEEYLKNLLGVDELRVVYKAGDLVKHEDL
ncbi:MAG: ParB N-terminal domain-containing protein [Methanobrevibacter sp.]|nr:ParB N-terminal domain-containing protein [Methanobrevibacter sp.]